jgi:uncharacterized protein (DUF1501 family)
MNRREFLITTSLLGLSSMANFNRWNLWAAPTAQSNSKLVIVFLRGAYDSLNTLVPYADSFYYESRPTISISPPDINNKSCLKLDNRWGLAPVLKQTIHPFFYSKQLSFIPFSGTDFISRSHFQAQDLVEIGLGISGKSNQASGFLGRLLEALNKQNRNNLSSVSFSNELPLIFRGAVNVPNRRINFKENFIRDVRREALFSSMFFDNESYERIKSGYALGEQVESAKNIINPREKNSGREFVSQGPVIGKILRETDYSIAFVDIPGWDTHINQGSATGLLPYRLSNLADGISGMVHELGTTWNKTTIVVLSEFGRTFRENGNSGTDHGHGSAIWVMGGSINGGKIIGDQVELRSSSLNQNRDLPVLNDYRTVFIECFQKMFGLSHDSIKDIFPNMKSYSHLGIL